MYRGADKSVVGPGRKQARKNVMDARDFNNIESLAVKFFFDVITSIVSFLWEYTTAARDVTF